MSAADRLVALGLLDGPVVKASTGPIRNPLVTRAANRFLGLSDESTVAKPRWSTEASTGGHLLKNMKIDRVDLVERPANPGAQVKLVKRAPTTFKVVLFK
jgi:hypothetical protein